MDIKIIIVIVVAVVLALAVITIATGALGKFGTSNAQQQAVASCQTCVQTVKITACAGRNVGESFQTSVASSCTDICKFIIGTTATSVMPTSSTC